MEPFTPDGIVKSTPNDEHCPIFSPVDPAGEDWELEHDLRNFSADREFEVVQGGYRVRALHEWIGKSVKIPSTTSAQLLPRMVGNSG